MSYLALYRKYRPKSFDEVRGQDHIVTTLKNQMITDRIGHAYLFCGTRGTGKTSVAKLFAKAVNCASPVNGSPCGDCPVCRSIDAQTSMNVTELDAASNNSVENIRDIIENSKYAPTEGRYKVFIIDEVHMLSSSAFNALLKTLEEPPSYVIFILATTEVHKIPITIMSRCQRYDFHRITTETISGCLADLMKSEGIETEDKALRYIARTADGSMRDAQSLLDQCIAFYIGQKLTYEKVLEVLGSVDIEVFAKLLRYINAGRTDGCMSVLDEVLASGRELSQFVTDFAGYLRNLLLAQSVDNPEDVLEFSRENMELIIHESRSIRADVLIRYISILSELSNRIRYASQKRLLIEVELIKMSRPQMQDDYNSILDRLRVLEEKFENGSFTVASPEQQISEDTGNAGEEALNQEELAAALPEDIRKIAENWNVVTDRVSRKDKLASALLSDAIPQESGGKLLLVLKDDLDVRAMQFRNEMNGELQPSRLDMIRDEIAYVTGKTVDIITGINDGRTSTKKKDITKLVKFEIRKKD